MISIHLDPPIAVLLVQRRCGSYTIGLGVMENFARHLVRGCIAPFLGIHLTIPSDDSYFRFAFFSIRVVIHTLTSLVAMFVVFPSGSYMRSMCSSNRRFRSGLFAILNSYDSA